MTLADDPELEDGHSPVEEAGHEVEGVEDEELGSTVEEGEEAALALDVQLTQSELQWLSIERASTSLPEMNHPACKDSGSNGEHEHVEASESPPESEAAEESSSAEWGIRCPSAQSDTCQSDNLA